LDKLGQRAIGLERLRTPRWDAQSTRLIAVLAIIAVLTRLVDIRKEL
jgi:hypothetical protein